MTASEEKLQWMRLCAILLNRLGGKVEIDPEEAITYANGWAIEIQNRPDRIGILVKLVSTEARKPS